MEFILAVIMWGIFSVLVGGFAERRGQSFGGWLVLSLLLSPLVCIVILLLMPDEVRAMQGQSLALQQQQLLQQQQQAAWQQQQFVQQQAAWQQQQLAQQTGSGAAAPASRSSSGVTGEATAGRLRQLAELRTSGVYTDEEFASRKRQILDELASSTRSGTPEDFLAAIVPLMQGNVLTQDEVARVKAFAIGPVRRG